MPPGPPRRKPASRPAARKSGAGASAMLVCQSGPAAGQEFVLEGDELAIGRAADNPVSIPDTSVSRKHALIRKTAAGWAISDLGSGNGTLLNGEAVADETELSEGDVISLGDTELKFAPEASAPNDTTSDADDPASDDDAGHDDDDNDGPRRPSASAPRRRPPVRTARAGGAIERSAPRRPVRSGRPGSSFEPPKKKKSLFVPIGAVLVVVLGSLVGYRAYLNRIEVNARIKQNQESNDRAQLTESFNQAKGLVRQGRWTEALTQLNEIKEADPEFEAQQIANYITIAQQEQPNQVALEEASAALKAGSLAKAQAALKKVKVTLQSEGPLRVVRDAIEVKVSERLAEARRLVGARDLSTLERLKAAAEDVLSVHDDDRDALELKRMADAAIFAIKNPTQAPVAPETPWLEVQSRFKAGDSNGALALAQACANRQPKCRELEAQIKEWEIKSKRVEELGENELVALFELDRHISGGSSSDQSRAIRTQLISKLFVKASQLKTTGNWSRAIEAARKVLQADPGHTGALSLINEARSQARDVYLRGYALRESQPDEAIRLFKDVMNMTPSDDELYAKAKARIAELQTH